MGTFENFDDRETIVLTLGEPHVEFCAYLPWSGAVQGVLDLTDWVSVYNALRQPPPPPPPPPPQQGGLSAALLAAAEGYFTAASEPAAAACEPPACRRALNFTTPPPLPRFSSSLLSLADLPFTPFTSSGDTSLGSSTTFLSQEERIVGRGSPLEPSGGGGEGGLGLSLDALLASTLDAYSPTPFQSPPTRPANRASHYEELTPLRNLLAGPQKVGAPERAE